MRCSLLVTESPLRFLFNLFYLFSWYSDINFICTFAVICSHVLHIPPTHVMFGKQCRCC